MKKWNYLILWNTKWFDLELIIVWVLINSNLFNSLHNTKMESFNEEIKTALVVTITNYKQTGYVFYYTIHLSKMYSGE